MNYRARADRRRAQTSLLERTERIQIASLLALVKETAQPPLGAAHLCLASADCPVCDLRSHGPKVCSTFDVPPSVISRGRRRSGFGQVALHWSIVCRPQAQAKKGGAVDQLIQYTPLDSIQ